MATFSSKSASQLDKIRSRIADIASELSELEHGSISREDAVMRIDRYIERQADKFYLGLSLFTSPDIGAVNHFPGFRADVRTLPDEAFDSANMAPALCALLSDAVRTRMIGKLDEDGDYGTPLSERPAMKKKLQAELLNLEIEEETFVMQAHEAGSPIERRTDIENVLVLVLKSNSTINEAA